MRKIAVLTSGGDAPGMNACIRAVERTALYYNIDVYGVERGWQGLIDGNLTRMETRSVSGLIHKGGTFLKTARCPEFVELEGQRRAAETLSAYGIEGVVAIGGDGTFHGAVDLCNNFGVKVVGIPGTIDNDLAYTDYTLGFDTAVNTVLWAMNNLRDTMTSHDRVSLLEVMGRRCGDIALYAGVAGGAEYVLVPEVPYDLDVIASSIRKSRMRGKTSNMIILRRARATATRSAPPSRKRRASAPKLPCSAISSAAARPTWRTVSLRASSACARWRCSKTRKRAAPSAYGIIGSSPFPLKKCSRRKRNSTAICTKRPKYWDCKSHKAA